LSRELNLAHLPDNGKAVQAGQHHVEDHHIKAVSFAQAKRLFAVVSQRY
jgi:hypothetical protein